MYSVFLENVSEKFVLNGLIMYIQHIFIFQVSVFGV